MYITHRDCNIQLNYVLRYPVTSAAVIFEYENFKSYDVRAFVNGVRLQSLQELQERLSRWDSEMNVKVHIIAQKHDNLKHSVLRFGIELNGFDVEAESIVMSPDTDIDSNIQNANIDNRILIKQRTGNLYNPYRHQNASKHLQQIFSKGLSDIYGHDVLWFKAVHEDKDASHVFREYEFATAMQQRQLLVVIKNNFIPENRTRFSEFDIDFQDEMEIHIDKLEWLNVFGPDIIPTADDCLWLPVNNRMYIVNAPFKERNYMQNDPFWKMIAIKYEKRNHVQRNEFVDSELDALFEMTADKFEQVLTEEKQDASGASTMSDSNNRPDADGIDMSTTSNTSNTSNIKQCRRMFNGAVIFDWHYTNLPKSYKLKQREYTEWTFMMWFRLPKDKPVKELVKSEAFKLHIDTDKLMLDNKFIRDVERDMWYAVAVAAKQVETAGHKHFEIETTLLDCNLHILATTNIVTKFTNITTINMFEGFDYANIRLNKKRLTSMMPLSYRFALQESVASLKQNWIVDNAIPTYTEPKASNQCLDDLMASRNVQKP